VRRSVAFIRLSPFSSTLTARTKWPRSLTQTFRHNMHTHSRRSSQIRSASCENLFFAMPGESTEGPAQATQVCSMYLVGITSPYELVCMQVRVECVFACILYSHIRLRACTISVHLCYVYMAHVNDSMLSYLLYQTNVAMVCCTGSM
jgi:hypothetical protein